MTYTKRYIARLVVEAETPIAIGSGEKGLDTDRLVAKDANGLPYIPGTSLAGVLRHSFENVNWVNSIFGFGGDKGTGSRLVFSSAFLIDEDGNKVMEGLKDIGTISGYYSYFNRLPERDHVRINHKGAADSENHGKFDEELVHKGTRFAFEIEFIANDIDKENWNQLIDAICSPTYRIGAGTRKGFGKLKVINELSENVEWDLKNENDLLAYINKSGSLNDKIKGATPLTIKLNNENLKGWKKYNLELKPDSFFSFSAGWGDEEADNQPKKERYFDWSSGKPKLTDHEYTLIPATSIKGALAHRVAYHYNLINENYIGDSVTNLESSLDIQKAIASVTADINLNSINLSSDSSEWEEIQKQVEQLNVDNMNEWKTFEDNIENETKVKKGILFPVGENNLAVQQLFGFAKNSEENQEGIRGRIIIDDIYLPHSKTKDKVFNHTKIDRFTNGTIDGALFQEKVTYSQEKVSLVIWVEEKAWEEDSNIQVAFENTLNELISGKLALGGSTTKGHGVFTGTIKS